MESSSRHSRSAGARATKRKRRDDSSSSSSSGSSSGSDSDDAARRKRRRKSGESSTADRYGDRLVKPDGKSHPKHERHRKKSTSRTPGRYKRKNRDGTDQPTTTKQRRKNRSSSSSDSETSDSSSGRSSSSTESSSSFSDSEEEERRIKRRHKHRKAAKEKQKQRKRERESAISKSKQRDSSKPAAPNLPRTTNITIQQQTSTGHKEGGGGKVSGAMKRGPMTREEWEKLQSVVRRVYDPDTGRHRLAERTATARELKMHAELNRQLQVQLSGVREEHQAVLGRLTEAHDLLEKHVETSNRAQESEKMLRVEAEQLKEGKQSLEAELTSMKEQLCSQKEELTAETNQWKAKASDVEQRLKSLQSDYSELQNAHDKLERVGEELKSEVEGLLGEREQWEQERCEGEERVRELEHRVTEMEKSMKETEQLQMKEHEVLVMPALEEAPAKSADELQVKDTTSLPVTASRPGQLALPPSPLSPEVISDSNSTSPSVPVKPLTLALPSPRLCLERIQLPLKRENYQLPWRPQSTEAGTTVAVDKKSPAKPSPKIAHSKNSKISSGTPLKSQATTSHYPNTKPTNATKTTPRCTDSFAPDQSVPNSPGGNSNFSIVFSEGEDEGEGVRKDEMISSQMIKKVTTFLKMDRLRRTKIPKL